MKLSEETGINVAVYAILGIMTLSAIAALAAVDYYVESWKCEARWGDRGEFVPLAGCMVETPQGRVPEDRVRVME